jgi:peptidoglycan/LPS O-acetylase OafA/YrhL
MFARVKSGIPMSIAATLDESKDNGRTGSTPIFLGSYRLLLAFLVFCAHSVWPLAQTITRPEIGPIGVLCFFTVSGFLITVAIEVHYVHSVRLFLVNHFYAFIRRFWLAC